MLTFIETRLFTRLVKSIYPMKSMPLFKRRSSRIRMQGQSFEIQEVSGSFGWPPVVGAKVVAIDSSTIWVARKVWYGC
jgi:hypothetical protein